MENSKLNYLFLPIFFYFWAVGILCVVVSGNAVVVLRGCTRISLTMNVNSDGDVSPLILIMMNLCPSNYSLPTSEVRVPCTLP